MAFISSPNNWNNLGADMGNAVLNTAMTSTLQEFSGWETAGGSSGAAVINNISQLNDMVGSAYNMSKSLTAGINSLVDKDWNSGVADEYAAAGRALTDAAIEVGRQFLQSKWERLQNLWNTKSKVKIGALIAETAPYSTDFETAIKALGNKVQNLIAYLLDIDIEGAGTVSYGTFATNLGKGATSALMNDASTNPQMLAAMNQLQGCTGFTEMMSIATTTIKLVKLLLKIKDLLKPTLEMIVDLANSYWTGGTSAVKASDEMGAIVGKIIGECGKAALGVIRKYVYDVELELPVIVTQSIKVLSVKDAVKTMDKGGFWYNLAYSKDYAGASQYLKKWQSWTETINTKTTDSNTVMLYAQTYIAVAQDAMAQVARENAMGNRNSSWGNFFEKNTEYSGLRQLMYSDSAGADYLKIITNNLTKAFMKSATLRARNTIGAMEPTVLPEDTEATFYEDAESQAQTTEQANMLQVIIESMADPDIKWTEELIRITSKQVYDKL